MRTQFSIGESLIGDGRCFVIAEAGVNHNGSLKRAKDLIDIAAEAGADAVKFQTFDADRLVTRDAPKAKYQAEATGGGESQHAMLKRLELSMADHHALMEHCAARDILFLSTPFDEEASDDLNSLGVVAFKTPSGELTNVAFLAHVAAFGKPMIVSTGMATLGDVEDAVAAIRGAGALEFALLHCVSNYPASPETINLRAMNTLAHAFGVPVGYSDHSEGLEVALAAVALGASVIEKHFTQDRNLEGPDHRASLEPAELHQLIDGIRKVEASLGDGRKVPADAECSTIAAARKSLIAARDIAQGERIGDEHLVARRPGTGIAPKERRFVVGRRARTHIPEGAVLDLGMLD